MYGEESRYNVTANEAFVNLANSAAAGTLTELTSQDAQAYANQGYSVIGAKAETVGSGHLVTVRPSSEPYDAEEGTLISNVGSSVGVWSAATEWGATTVSSGAIKYYYDPNQTFLYDTSNVAKEQ
jgi:hypothetical protein